MLDLIPVQLLFQTRFVCHRFHGLIARIIHARLLRAASLSDRKLILECYHPSAQYTEPYLYCDYLGTPGLSDKIQDQPPIFDFTGDQTAKEGTLKRLYSHFQPTRKDPEPKIYRSHPAGNVPGSRASELANRVREPFGESTVSQNVSLEAHELFTQLRFLVAVVQTGPRRGFFLSVENLIDKTQRIFRNWLAERAEAIGGQTAGASNSVTNEHGCGADRMLWVDQKKIVGLRVRVEERKGRKESPILYNKDEDQAVSYSLELGGMSPPNIQMGSVRRLVLVLKICRVDCKYYTSDARCGTNNRDRRRREPPGYNLWELCDAERTADRGDLWKNGLIGKGRIAYNAQIAADDSIHISRSMSNVK